MIPQARVAAAAAAAFLALSAPAGALAVLDDAGALRVLVEGADARAYALLVAGGPPARFEWTTPDGETHALVLNASERALSLAPGAHVFEPRERAGGLLLVFPDDPTEAGAAFPLDPAPARERAFERVPWGGAVALLAGVALLAVCSRKLKGRWTPGTRRRPGGDR